MMNCHFKDFTEAWELINEMFIDPPTSLLEEYDGGRQSKATYLFNFKFTVRNPVLDPEFDFGRKFNYHDTKWSMLLGNYICMTEIQAFKEEIKAAKAKNSSATFNLSYQFKNKHKNGKGCLISMVVTKRLNSKPLHLTINLRASEVTKRLAVDLLLIQRLGEFLFDNLKFEVTVFCNQIFNDDTVLLMYHTHKDLRPLLDKSKSPISKELLSRLEDMLVGPEEKFKKYKIHFRAFKVLRPDLYKYPKTLAKDCVLPQPNLCDLSKKNQMLEDMKPSRDRKVIKVIKIDKDRIRTAELLNELHFSNNGQNTMVIDLSDLDIKRLSRKLSNYIKKQGI